MANLEALRGLESRQKYVWWFGAALILSIAFLHVWQINVLPRGLYVDESSIGYNAALIAAHLRDEHGVFLPVYFEAFGEYKNPLYIYTVAILFKFFGVSVWWLRFASFVWFVAFWAGLAKLAWTIFPSRKNVLFYALVAGGTIPWLFSLSRISFEVISQPAVIIWALWAIYQSFELDDRRTSVACVAGGLVGLSVYTYSTGRLLGFLIAGLVIALYAGQKYWHRLGMFASGLAVALIPYAWFGLTNHGALTARFDTLSYLTEAGVSWWLKAGKFIAFYFSYFSPEFLFLRGDGNLRHHTGSTGELYLVIGLLAVVGISLGVQQWHRRGELTHWRYWLFLLVGLAISPVAGALTEPDHSLRAIMLGVYVLVFSLYGYAWVDRFWGQKRLLWLGMIWLFLFIQSSYYFYNYFVVYPPKTVAAFQSYNFSKQLTKALSEHPNEVIVSSQGNMQYAELKFYEQTIPRSDVPIILTQPMVVPGSCLIYSDFDKGIYPSEYQPTYYSDTSGFTHLACFDKAISNR